MARGTEIQCWRKHMDNVLLEQLLQALALVVANMAGVAFVAIARALLSWIKVKVGSDKYDYLLMGAKTIVRFIEQSAAWDELLADGSLKKERALVELSEWAGSRGLPVTYELLDRIIEEAVNVMNAEIGKLDPMEPIVGFSTVPGHPTPLDAIS